MALRLRLQRFAVRVVGLSLIAGALLSLPDIETDGQLRYKNAATALVFILTLGNLLLLLYKVFAQVFASGTPVLDEYIARSLLAHVVTLLHHVAPQDTLTTMALQAGLHSVVNLHAAAHGSDTRKFVRCRLRHGT